MHILLYFIFSSLYLIFYSFHFMYISSVLYSIIFALSMERTWLTFHCWLYTLCIIVYVTNKSWTWTWTRQGCILSPFLFNLYAEVIFRNAKLEESEEGFRIGGHNVNNLRYANDTKLIASSLEGMRNILRAIKHESQNMGLFLNMAKTKILTTDDYDQDTFQLDGDETEVVNVVLCWMITKRRP